jgi:aspartate 4-decarboxylase
MEETFKEPCNAYYKIFVDKEDIGYKYRSLSPFEFKNTLIKLAHKNKGEILDAGRGNPNFFSTLPRYAFALLQLFATHIGEKLTPLDGIGFIPEEKGIGAELKKLININIDTISGKFLSKAFKKIFFISGFSED